MKLGNRLYFLSYFLFFNYVSCLAEDKIISSPLINLEKIKPSFEEVEEIYSNNTSNDKIKSKIKLIPSNLNTAKFIGLDKIDKDGGCLRVVPQSHLLNNMPDSLKDNHKAIDLEIDEGDLIIFSSQLHHATNKTKKNIDPPWSLLLTYRSWWCKQQFDFCFAKGSAHATGT